MTPTIHPALPLSNLKQGVASIPTRMYRPTVAANSATGRENPNIKLAHKRPMSIAGAFSMPAMSLYGGRAREAFGSAGCQLARFLTPRTAATQSREKDRGSSMTQVGATHMHALNPSKVRAAAHRAMAIAALHADSSLSVRLNRYRHHMDRARALTAVEVAQ